MLSARWGVYVAMGLCTILIYDCLSAVTFLCPIALWNVAFTSVWTQHQTRTVFWRCSNVVGSVNGNASNMRTQIWWQHPDVPITGMRRKQTIIYFVFSVSYSRRDAFQFYSLLWRVAFWGNVFSTSHSLFIIKLFTEVVSGQNVIIVPSRRIVSDSDSVQN